MQFMRCLSLMQHPVILGFLHNADGFCELGHPDDSTQRWIQAGQHWRPKHKPHRTVMWHRGLVNVVLNFSHSGGSLAAVFQLDK